MTLPIVVLSHCLADRACRYDGQAIRDPIVAQLQSQLRFIPVCPEVETPFRPTDRTEVQTVF